MVDKTKAESVVAETQPTNWRVVEASALEAVKVRPQVMREVVLALQANQHRATANTKRRGEVRGGGKKPWRQKGTGRARTGSIRNPLWRGGGITFGPLKIKNYQQHPTTMLRQQALFGAMKLKLAEGKVTIWTLAQPIAKTKLAIKELPQLLVADPTLVVVPNRDFKTGLRNLSNVRLVAVTALNALEVASARQIIFVNDTFDQLKSRIKA